MLIHARRICAVLLAAVASSYPAKVSAQITAGQVNNFENGTTQGWLINLLGLGSPPPSTIPVNVPTDGPTGLNDNFLRLTAVGGSGAGSRLMSLNPAFWGGNYIAAGITSIRLNAINLGRTDLALRFYIEDPMGAPPTNLAISNTAIPLLVGSGWQTLEFPLFGPNGLAAFIGTVSGAMTNATVVRIAHSPTFTPEPNPVVGSLGLDNITAVATVPEPSTVVLVAAGAFGIVLFRRRRVS